MKLTKKYLLQRGLALDEIDLIESNQESAEKYNDLMNANAQVVKDNINTTKEHQIIEKIKEHYVGTSEHISDCSVCAYLAPIMEVLNETK